MTALGKMELPVQRTVRCYNRNNVALCRTSSSSYKLD